MSECKHGREGICAACIVEEPLHDPVQRPEHYTSGKIECIDAIEAATEGLTGIEAFCTGNVIKYVWRWKRKNGVEDLKKARWYLEKLIQRLKGANTHE